jgi:hypothetical protein
MALQDFYPISLNEDHAGLVWHDEVEAGKYLAELQTGVLPQLVHLVIFDIEDEYKPVYTTLAAYTPGQTLDDEHMAALQSAIAVGLEELNA